MIHYQYLESRVEYPKVFLIDLDSLYNGNVIVQTGAFPYNNDLPQSGALTEDHCKALITELVAPNRYFNKKSDTPLQSITFIIQLLVA